MNTTDPAEARAAPMMTFLVVMGVAGCGKSSLAARVAQAEGVSMIEGDEHHGPANLAKMKQGIALDDRDRAGWLDRLADLLQQHPHGAVLSCSALKLAYRNRLRAAVPNLQFAFLDIDRSCAMARVQARAGAHFFSTALVDSQFATLESPVGEPGVLRLDAELPLDALQLQVSTWLGRTDSSDALDD